MNLMYRSPCVPALQMSILLTRTIELFFRISFFTKSLISAPNTHAKKSMPLIKR